MTEPLFVNLRNEISGVTTEFTPALAKQFLDHPVFGQNLKEVRTTKPEILGTDKTEDSTEPTTVTTSSITESKEEK